MGARSLRDERGNVLISVVLVSLIVGALAALALRTGEQATWSSASDRNHEAALGVAEAGVHEVVGRLAAQASGTYTGSCDYLALTPGSMLASPSCDGTTAQGTYTLSVQRTTQGFVVDALGEVGGGTLGRARRLKVSVLPPRIARDGKSRYALFSYTSIDIKNNDEVYGGDVFANDSVFVDQNAMIDGTVTSAKSWIKTDNGSTVRDLHSGGYHPTGLWSMDIAGTVNGWVKASSMTPNCTGDTRSNYDVRGGNIAGSLTTLGRLVSGSAGSRTEDTCTPAAPAQPLPSFTYNPANYDPTTLREFATVADFNAWRRVNPGPVQGTFVVLAEPYPSQDSRIDLSGWSIDGDTTILTNAPVYTGEIDDEGVADGAKASFVVVSHYQPPVGTSCDYNDDDSECAIHSKNHFDPSCKTAVLLYADRGPVAMKNTTSNPNDTGFCGSVYSDGIVIKNNQKINYDPGIERPVGFGPVTYEIARWEEMAP